MIPAESLDTVVEGVLVDGDGVMDDADFFLNNPSNLINNGSIICRVAYIY